MKIQSYWLGKVFKFFSILMYFFCCVFLFADESLNEPPPMQPKKSNATVNIEQAQRTEYRKDIDTGRSVIVLEGDVILSVTQSNSKTIINADLINFEKDRQMLFAEGNVKLQKMSGSKLNETLTANTLLFNVETLEGIFDGGRIVQEQTDALNLPSGSTLIVSSDIFGRDESGTIAFKNGSLTFCEDPDPHWKIKASRIWLLPGNEFAFFNALLYVGKLPVFYLPFFYYPKDEMIINPAFGYNARRGYSIQTTFYITGRKPLQTNSNEDSFFDFLKPTQLKKQVREGLFMRNLEENDSAPEKYWKIMADYYTYLGGMLGTTGVFKPNSVLTNFEFSLALGFSRVLKQEGNRYVPLKDDENKIIFDKSNLFGLNLPFRYAANLKATISHSIGNLTLSMPLYSDAYFNSDFLTDRKESMDWIDFFMNNSSGRVEEVVTTSETSSFTWALNGSLKPPIKKINPYVSNFSLSSITSSLTFYSKLSDTYYNAKINDKERYEAQRKFYYPSQIVPFKGTLNFSGTIYQYPKQKATVKKEQNSLNKIAFIIPDELKTEEQLEKDRLAAIEAEKKAAAEAAEEEELTKALEQEKIDENNSSEEDSIGKPIPEEDSIEKPIPEEDSMDKFLPDTLLPTISVAALEAPKSSTSILKYSLSYSLVPVFSSLISYNQDIIKSNEDIDLKNIMSTFYSISTPIELKSALSFGSVFSMNNNLKYTFFKQEHPTLNEDEKGNVGGTKKETILTNDYSAQKNDLQMTNNINFKPFYGNNILGDTSLSYSHTFKLLETDFDDEYYKENGSPSYNHNFVEWTDDYWTAHNLNANFAFKQKTNYMQKLGLQLILPPKNMSVVGQISFTFPYLTLNGKFSQKEKIINATETEEEKKEWIWEPINLSMSSNLFNNDLRFNLAYTYNPEEEVVDENGTKKGSSTSLSVGLIFKSFNLSYSQQFTYKYDLITTKEPPQGKTRGWNISDSKDFIPYSLKFSYSTPSLKLSLWNEKISLVPSLSTSLIADLVRPTNTYFTFSPTLKFSINKLVDISFSLDSRNDMMFWYFPKLFPWVNVDEATIKEKQQNIFKHLLWSLDLFSENSESNRKKTGFKMKSLNLKVEHNLHDWDLSLEVRVQPTLYLLKKGEKEVYEYRVDPYFALSVIWRPMNSMKTSVVRDFDEYANDGAGDNKWQLNPGD